MFSVSDVPLLGGIFAGVFDADLESLDENQSNPFNVFLSWSKPLLSNSLCHIQLKGQSKGYFPWY